MREERFITVSVLDPALETERMTYDEVRDFVARRDWNTVANYIKPGEHPTRYHVRECPNELWAWVMGGGDDDEARYERAFRCCVERADNVYQRDGVRLESWAPTNTNGRPAAMSEAEAWTFPRSERAEIGRVCYEHSFFPRRIAECFRLHASLGEPLGRRTVRLAASIPTTESATSNGKPSGSTGTIPDTTASDSAPAVGGSDKATDASVQASP